MSKKGQGRPASFTTEEIKMVINQYVEFSEGRLLFTASDIARFAQTKLGMNNFKYYVIQRNVEAKQYLKETNERIKQAAGVPLKNTTAIFKTLDIPAMLQMDKSSLGNALSVLNIAFEEITDKQANTIQDNFQLNKKVTVLKGELAALQSALFNENELHRSVMMRRDDEVSALKQRISDLEQAVHVAWDNEAESVLKQLGLLESDGTPINSQKTIESPDTDLEQIIGVIPVITKEPSTESNIVDLRKNFLERLEDI
ncbi:hypothetical protein [Oscillibacter sp.]|uniref:hypothetical protein n=1 Tax=Oscillibacter sp. TaxID=1945593 RepID=UPI00339AC376